MSLVTKFEIEKTQLNVNCLIPNSDYLPYKERVESQLLKNVEVPGFRKGKAPKEIAIKQLNEKVFTNQVWYEVIDKFFPEILKEVDVYLDKNNRAKSDQDAQIKETTMLEVEAGFEFLVVVDLLADIDLDFLKKIKIKKANPKDLENAESFESALSFEEKRQMSRLNEYEKISGAAKKDSMIEADVEELDLTHNENAEPKKDIDAQIRLGLGLYPEAFEKELIGLKAGETREFKIDTTVTHSSHTHDHHLAYKITCKEVYKPKYKTLSELLEHSEIAKKELKSYDSFKQTIRQIYDLEIANELQKVDNRNVINELVKTVKINDLPITKIDAEVERIYSTLKGYAEQDKISLAEVYAQTGLPTNGKKSIKDAEVFDLLRQYVENEFKLLETIKLVYGTKISEKITETQIQDLANKMQKNPKLYGVSQADLQSLENLKNVAADRLIRESAFSWILTQVEFVD